MRAAHGKSRRAIASASSASSRGVSLRKASARRSESERTAGGAATGAGAGCLAAAPAVRSLSERLADAFRSETPRLLGELADAIAQRDFPRAARIAHNIKGSAYYIHSEQMAEDAGGLEQACDAVDDAGVERHWAALQESIDDWMTAH